MASQTMRAITGVVEAVGPEVSDFAVGDEVYGATGLRLGAYGEFVVVPARAAIAAKPASMTFAEAAAVPLGVINALHFLRRAEVEPGDSVLINGAGGVIGAYGVQVARMMGAEVTGERIQTADRSREPGSPRRARSDDRCERVVQHRRPSPPNGAGVRSTSPRGHRATRRGTRARHWARCQRTTSPKRTVTDPLVEIPGWRLPEE